MLKYKLTIEGSAEEIEKSIKYYPKTTFISSSQNHRMSVNGRGLIQALIEVPIDSLIPITEIEYITRQPRYRVKHLGELAKEYGEELSYHTTECSLSVKGLACPMNILGAWGADWIISKYNDEWKRIFLREVNE